MSDRSVQLGPTWYCWLSPASISIPSTCNVAAFLQAEFALSDRAVSLHSRAIAVGIMLVGLLGDRAEARQGRRRTQWLGIGGLAGGSTLLCSHRRRGSASRLLPDGALGGMLPAVLADLHDERRVNAGPKPLHWPCGAAESVWPEQIASFAQWTTRATPVLY